MISIRQTNICCCLWLFCISWTGLKNTTAQWHHFLDLNV